MTIIAFNRQWVVRWHWLVVNIIAIVILLSLSVWQWQRAIQKQESLQSLAQWKTQKALTLKELTADASSSPISFDNLMARDGAMINFSAQWIAPYMWLVDNQIINGRPGYDVLVPVRENNSEKNGTSVISLVNLGWVEAPLQRNELPVVHLPSQFTVQGIYRARAGNFLLGKNLEDNGQWPMRIQQPDNQLLATYLPSTLLSGVIYQQQESPFLIHYHPVVLPPERHKAYALQWFLLAVAAALVGLACAKGADTSRLVENAL